MLKGNPRNEMKLNDAMDGQYISFSEYFIKKPTKADMVDVLKICHKQPELSLKIKHVLDWSLRADMQSIHGLIF